MHYQETDQCDFPLDPKKRAEIGRCMNHGHTELMIKDERTGQLYHMLWLCRKHSHTNKRTIVADGEQHDETCYKIESEQEAS